MTETDARPRETRAWSFGCPHWADPGGEFTEQLRLANSLWNALVEIARAHDEAKDAIWRSDAGVRAAVAACEKAALAVDQIREEMRTARATDRSTLPRAHDSERLRAAREALASVRADLKAERKRALPALREQFSAGSAARRATVKATYSEYVQERGLGWGTYNDIVRRRFPAADKKVSERRAAGLHAEMHFRRFDGQGSLTVQVSRQAGLPAAPFPAVEAVPAVGSSAADPMGRP